MTTTIQMRTYHYIKGLKYIHPSQIKDIYNLVCHDLQIDKTEGNLLIVTNTIEIYFNTLNNK